MEVLNEKVIRALASQCFGYISPDSTPACEIKNISYATSKGFPVVTYTVVIYTENGDEKPVTLKCVWFNMIYYGYVLLVRNVTGKYSWLYSYDMDKALIVTDSVQELMKNFLGDL